MWGKFYKSGERFSNYVKEKARKKLVSETEKEKTVCMNAGALEEAIDKEPSRQMYLTAPARQHLSLHLTGL